MKDQKFGPIPVLLLTLAGGLAGFVLRLMMLTVGYDAQGVQIPGSWPMVSLWVLSGVVLIGLAALCLGMGKRAGLEENFKASPVAGAGAMVAGLVFFVCSLVQLLDKPDLFSMVVYALGLGGGSALAYNGYLRLSGKVSAPAGMLVSLYLAALLICRFRGWSADPLLGDYCFQLLGHGCLHGGCLSAGRPFLWERGGGAPPSSGPWLPCSSAASPWRIRVGPGGCFLRRWFCGNSPAAAPC